MEELAQLGGGLYTLVAIVIGVKLIALSARTRQLPEILVGSSMVLLAGFGYPLSAVAREATQLSETLRGALGVVAVVFAAVGVTANTAFTWVLFRREDAWAKRLVFAVGLASAGLLTAQALAGNWMHGRLFWGLVPGLITISYGWACLEAARYHGLLRRRLAIGLADPVVVDRFRLYSVATGMAVLINLVGWVFFSLGIEMLVHPIGGAVLFGCGTLSSTLMLLAFLPPEFYLASIRRRAATAA